MLQNLKVGQKILLSFLVVLLLLIVLLVSNLSGIKTVNNYAAIRREGKTAYIHLLLTQHKVLTLIYNTSLTNEARLKALEEWHKHVEDFHETIKLIKSIAKESDLLAHVDALDKHFTRYDELTDKAGEAAIRAGLDFSSGILLQINQTGQAAEKSVVQRDDLELKLMDARRFEKKFLVTNHDEDAEKFRDRMNKYVKALQAEGFPEDTITKANEYSKTFEDLYTAKREVDKAIAEAVQIGNNDMKQEIDAVFEIIDGTKDKLGLVKKAFNRIYATSFTITGLAIILSIVIGLLLTSNLVPPIVSLQKNVLIVADGDYSRVIPHAKSKDEIGDLTEAVIKMKWVTRELLEKVSNSSTHVASASQELSATADETGKGVQMVATVIQEVANGAQDIAKNLEVANQNLRQTSMAVEEVTKDIEQVSHFSEESRQDAIKGSEQAIYAVEQINNVKHTVEQTSSVIQSLGEKSAQIGEIVGLITGIASQTNLLALNAAIEAARAGEAGRGFAVVADEVRKLAEESSSAAQNIRHLIDEITAEMDKALNAMTTTTQEVDRGADLVSETGSALVEIVSSIEKIAQQVEGVSAAAEEMNASIHEVMEAMHHITTDAERAAAGAEEASSATQEQTAAVEEVDASAHSLAKLAEELQTTVHKFKL